VHCLQNYLYAVGGNDGATSLDSCERYDPLLNKWVYIQPMSRRRAGAGMAELNGKLYVVGEYDC
jgi:kelch-like protein 8